MQLLSFILLLAFILLRNSFTIFKGNRERTKVESLIYWGRKLIECPFILRYPDFCCSGDSKNTSQAYVLGVLLSLKGLFLCCGHDCRVTKIGVLWVMIPARPTLAGHTPIHDIRTMRERSW